ncbi:MAG: hypothetical protein U1F49_14820 [Rubrivivax sp.]
MDTREFAPGSRAQGAARAELASGEFIVLQLGRMVPRSGRGQRHPRWR